MQRFEERVKDSWRPRAVAMAYWVHRAGGPEELRMCLEGHSIWMHLLPLPSAVFPWPLFLCS